MPRTPASPRLTRAGNTGAANAARSQHTPEARGRGRPPQGPEAEMAIRQRLLDATRAVFTRVGYHGLSVELVSAEAGLSRPTFYKHFRNTDEPITIVIQAVNDQLIESLLSAVAEKREPFAALEAGLDAWRRWGDALGPMLQPLFAELHDPHSPARPQRQRTLGILAARLSELTVALGRQPPTRVQVDALLNGVEYLGYRFQLETPRDAAHWKQTRDAMLRLALGLLGTEHEWQHAAQLAKALDVDLNPRDVI
jgi:TetR/AcrR family transcriptional regulator